MKLTLIGLVTATLSPYAASSELRGGRELVSIGEGVPCLTSYSVTSTKGCTYKALIDEVKRKITAQRTRCRGRSAEDELKLLLGLADSVGTSQLNQLVDDACQLAYDDYARVSGITFEDITEETTLFTEEYYDGGTVSRQDAGPLLLAHVPYSHFVYSTIMKDERLLIVCRTRLIPWRLTLETVSRISKQIMVKNHQLSFQTLSTLKGATFAVLCAAGSKIDKVRQCGW